METPTKAPRKPNQRKNIARLIVAQGFGLTHLGVGRSNRNLRRLGGDSSSRRMGMASGVAATIGQKSWQNIVVRLVDVGRGATI